MLIALITILFLGGGLENAVLDYVGYIQGSIDEDVLDGERQSDAKATLKTMKQLTSTHAKSNEKAFVALLDEMSELDGNSDAVNAIWDAYYQDVESYNEQMINLRFQLRDSLTRAEWEAIFGGSPE